MKYILMIAGLVLAFQLSAQEKRFFVPKEVRDAYEAGTRSKDGAPGPNYWQNTVDYTIEASLDPTTRTLSGDLSATYYNN
ncbi:MAG: M1 family peptidase, partial [Cyclobacteriaceae bacterium]